MKNTVSDKDIAEELLRKVSESTYGLTGKDFLLELPKKVTEIHTARHTFATTVTLNNDVPMESVSKMLGHKTIHATQHYAKLSDKKLSHDVQFLYSV